LIGKQIKAEVLTAWLERFAERLRQSPIQSSEQHQELGKRLEQLGNLGWGKLSTLSAGLARELIPVEEEVAPEVEVIEAEFAEDGLPRVEPELESPTVIQPPDFSPAMEEGATELTEKLEPFESELSDEKENLPESLTTVAEQETELTEELEPFESELPDEKENLPENLATVAEELPSLDEEICNQPDNPDDDEICFNRGVVLYDLGRLEDALSCFVEILERQPQKSEVWFNLGVILYDLGKLEEAIAAFDRAVAIKPNFYQAWINRGVALKKLGRTQEALASLNQALQIQPHNPKAWMNRGNVLLHLGKTDRAIACYNRARELKDYSAEK
jgi:tetratricopeptide (TPR) repeat protein